MSKIKRYLPFWEEFLFYLIIALGMLMHLISRLTKELLFSILTLVIIVALVLGSFWISIEEYELRLGKKGFLGGLLLCVYSLLLPSSNSMTGWIWVELCMVLLASGLILYDIASKRDLSNAERGDCNE